jgi:hypothetical protein
LVEWWKFWKKKEGPFTANRLLNSKEVKIDQVFTSDDEKPIALLFSTTEEIVSKTGGEGYFGPTKMGVKGNLDEQKKWVTRGFVFPENMPQAISQAQYHSITSASEAMGTLYPRTLQYDEVNETTGFALTPSTNVTMEPSGITVISGDIRTTDTSTTTTKSKNPIEGESTRQLRELMEGEWGKGKNKEKDE